MLHRPARSPLSASRRFPLGSRRSPSALARCRTSSFRRTTGQMACGMRRATFESTPTYTSDVAWSASSESPHHFTWITCNHQSPLLVRRRSRSRSRRKTIHTTRHCLRIACPRPLDLPILPSRTSPPDSRPPRAVLRPGPPGAAGQHRRPARQREAVRCVTATTHGTRDVGPGGRFGRESAREAEAPPRSALPPALTATIRATRPCATSTCLGALSASGCATAIAPTT